MLKYALRYVPLLILALVLVPFTIVTAINAKNGFRPASGGNGPAPYSALYGVAILSENDAWAVGGSFKIAQQAKGDANAAPIPAAGRILHYDGKSWGEMNAREPLSLPLLAVALDAVSDGWAVGYNGTFVHWNGVQWRTVAGPASMNKNLLGIALLSSVDGWAVGYSGTILHYDGLQWRLIPSPTVLDLRSVAMVSAEEGWAVGDNGIMLHYRDGAWSVLHPSPTTSTLRSITMLSAEEGWVTGDNGTILHYRDGTWIRVMPVNSYSKPALYQSVTFSSIAMASLRSGWIVADQHVLMYSQEAWLEQSGTVSSTNVKVPDANISDFALYDVAASASGEVWAVGKTVNSGDMVSQTNNVDKMAILVYKDDTWNVVAILT